MDLLQLFVAFFFGASVASFLNLAADRLPVGQSLLHPASHCVVCHRRLAPWELVPVLSYVGLRGRCYQCGARIPLRMPLVEVSLGLMASYLWWRSGLTIATFVLFAYVGLFLLLALIDLEFTIIPNVVVYPALGVTLLLSPWWGVLGLERSFLGSESALFLLLGSLAGAAMAGGLFTAIILIYPGSMGWGDPKMAVLIGLVMGIPGTLVALLLSLISGGAVALGLLLLRLCGRKDSMPFGPFLALGAIAALLWGDSLWEWYVGLLTAGS